MRNENLSGGEKQKSPLTRENICAIMTLQVIANLLNFIKEAIFMTSLYLSDVVFFACGMRF